MKAAQAIIASVSASFRRWFGPEFIARNVRDWISAVGAKTANIEPGSPWKIGYCESINTRFRGECLNGKVFYSLKEAQIIIEEWRRHDNTVRPLAPRDTDRHSRELRRWTTGRTTTNNQIGPPAGRRSKATLLSIVVLVRIAEGVSAWTPAVDAEPK